MRALALLLTLFISACGGSSSSAKAIELSLSAVEDGVQKARPRRHVPIVVDIVNPGRETVRGALQVFRSQRTGVALSKIQMFHERQLEVPSGRRRVTVHYFVQDNDPCDRLALIFKPDDPKQPVSKPVFPSVKLIHDKVVALIISKDERVQALFSDVTKAGVEGSVAVLTAVAQTKSLPVEAHSYEPYDAIVIANHELSDLDSAARRALLTWTEQGGTLLVAPGLQSGYFRRHGLRRDLPVIGQSQVNDVAPTGLGRVVRLDDPREAMRVHTVQAKGSAEVVAALPSKQPLLVHARYGLGRMLVLTVPLNSRAFRGWSGRRLFLENLMPGPSVMRDGSETPPPIDEYLLNYSSSLEPLKPPSILLIGPILLLYALLVAPLSYRWAKAKRSAGLFFVAAFIFITVSCVAIFSTVMVGRGLHSVASHASVVRVPVQGSGQLDKARAAVRSHVGLFANSSNVLDIESELKSTLVPLVRKAVPHEGLVREVGDGSVVLPRTKIKTWSFRRFEERRLETLGVIESKLDLNKDRIFGSVHNRTSMDIEDAYLIMAGQIARLGKLKLGQVKEVVAPLFPIRKKVRIVEAISSLLVKDIEHPRVYYPEFAPDEVAGAERVLSTLVRTVQCSHSPVGRLQGLIVGFTESKQCALKTGMGESLAKQRVMVQALVDITCQKGQLRLTGLRPLVRSSQLALTTGMLEDVYSVQPISDNATGPKLYGLLDLEFSVPLPPGGRFHASEIIVEAGLEIPQDVLSSKDFQIKLYDFRAGAFTKALPREPDHFRYKATNPERFVDPRQGQVVLRIRNESLNTVDVLKPRIRIAGQIK